MATLLLKKSYQLSNLKEVNFNDLWGSRGVFTTMRMVGKPPKLILLKPHLENLIKSSKKYGIRKKNLKSIIKDLIDKADYGGREESRGEGENVVTKPTSEWDKLAIEKIVGSTFSDMIKEVVKELDDMAKYVDYGDVTKLGILDYDLSPTGVGIVREYMEGQNVDKILNSVGAVSYTHLRAHET